MKAGYVKTYLLTLGIMYILSAVLLAVMSFVIWKSDAGSGTVGGCVIAVYIISNVFGGFMVGKQIGKQKFFWGAMIGLGYFLVLLLAGIWGFGSSLDGSMRFVSCALICGVSGMFGGMLAPGNGK